MDQVKTGKTCSNISCEKKLSQFFKKQRGDENIEKGRELVEKEVCSLIMR